MDDTRLTRGQWAVGAVFVATFVLTQVLLWMSFSGLDQPSSGGGRTGGTVVRVALVVTATATVVSGLAVAASIRGRFRSAAAAAYQSLALEMEQRRATEQLLEEQADDLVRYAMMLEQANNGLVHASRAKDEFISVVSHELRTPLTSICGFSQTIRAHWDELSPAQLRSMVAAIDRQGRRLTRLVDDLLVMSRMMSGTVEPDVRDVDVRMIVNEALETAEMPADETSVIAEGSAWALADPDHLQRILVNLLVNARKYGAPPYAVRIMPGPTAVAVAIRDHGPGVPDEFVPALFDKFTQADSGSLRSSAGVGLGLAIVDELAQANGGRVTYTRPDDGVGAEFTVTVPIAPPGDVADSTDALTSTV